MSSQALRDARRYEEVFEQMIMPEERPAFHLSSHGPSALEIPACRIGA